MKILFKLAITITLSLSVVINANAFDIYGFKDIKFGTHLRKLQISTLGPAMLREEKSPSSSNGFTRNIWIANNGASISVIKLEPVMICKGMFDCEDNSEEQPIVIYSSIEETEKIIKAIKPNKPKKPILLNDF